MKKWLWGVPIVITLMFFSFIAAVAGIGKQGAEQLCVPQSTYLQPVNASLGVADDYSSPEQQAIAKIVVGVGVGRSFSNRDIKIALRTGIAESGLRNLTYGDRDSVGVFQIRPSQGHGTRDQIMDPVYSTNNFYDRMSKVANRDSLSEMEVAIRTQRPSRAAYEAGFPRTEAPALAILAGIKVDQTPTGEVVAPEAMMPSELCTQLAAFNLSGINPAVETVVQAAISQQGKLYGWNDGLTYDGSGFTQWAYAKGGVKLPLGASGQNLFGAQLAPTNLKAFASWVDTLQKGDLVYWTDRAAPSSLSIKHVAMYLGANTIIDASAKGSSISIKPIYSQNATLTILGATRPPLPATATNLNEGWVWPLKSITVTSPFGQRFHPTQRVWMLHDGVDFAASLGTPIYAAHKGTVAAVVPNGQVVQPYGRGFGNQVIIDHGSGVKTGYAHMSRFAPGIVVGQVVQAKQLIGYAGTTGWSTGSHLHYRILINRKAVDPIVYLRQFGLVP